MPTFHPLKVTTVERTAEDAVCIGLAVPRHLGGSFAFHAGQYVTLRRTIDGREEHRTYSIVSAPGAETLKIGVRLQPHGRMSTELGRSLSPGGVLDIGTPAGRFRTQIDPGRSHSYVAFAAGSGITPILSLAADVLAREQASRFMLVYGNRSMSRTMFLEETLALKNRYLGRFAVYFVMSREPQHTEMLNGRIDGSKVRELAHHLDGIGTADEYFVCGPGAMADQVRSTLAAISRAPVRIERFATAAVTPVTQIQPGTDPIATADEVLAHISVTMDGRTRSFAMVRRDASVLDAAERAGLELPFSCRSGICATCRVRVVEGSVVMAHNIALQPWEIDAGFVLCCQARPTRPRLHLSYDHK